MLEILTLRISITGMDAPSMEVFKAKLGVALSNVI